MAIKICEITVKQKQFTARTKVLWRVKKEIESKITNIVSCDSLCPETLELGQENQKNLTDVQQSIENIIIIIKG